MNQLIAYCGLNCNECEAYKATLADSNKDRVRVAEKWSEEFKADIKPEDINCSCCIKEDTNFLYCSMCGIRKCSKEKGLINCAYCPDFPCDLLTEFLKKVPSAKEMLTSIKESLT